MAKNDYDGVVEAVHYTPNGEVDWVRAYERRGSIFSDHLLIKRQDLIKRMKAGRKFMVGRRIPLRASTFEVDQPLRLVNTGDGEAIVVGQAQSERDRLDGVPVI